MSELDIDGEPGEANPDLYKQMIQENAWHIIIQRAWNKRIFMATGQYPRRTSGASTVNRQASQAIMVQHVCHHNTLPKIILQGTVDGSRRRGRPRRSWKDNTKEWTGQSMSSLLRIADERVRWAVIAADTSVGVPNDAWASWVLVS